MRARMVTRRAPDDEAGEHGNTSGSVCTRYRIGGLPTYALRKWPTRPGKDAASEGLAVGCTRDDSGAQLGVGVSGLFDAN